jgi:large subunit ribosomal protein L23
MKTAHDIIIKPIITERSMDLTRNVQSKKNKSNKIKYVFQVMRGASKTEIKQAVEAVFKGVKVDAVNTMNMKPKKKRLGMRPAGAKPAWKKAIVTLKEDSETIDFFDSMV